MNRIHQIDPASTGGRTRELLDAAKTKYGRIPNAFRILGNSAAALEGYLGLSRALAGGVLPARLREQISLAVAEINGCGYCLSAHVISGRKAGLGEADVLAARRSAGFDGKSDAALKLARSIALQRGQISDSELQNARGAGFSDAEIVEVVLNVALNTLTNYLNNVARTEIDFPEVTPGHFPSEEPIVLNAA